MIIDSLQEFAIVKQESEFKSKSFFSMFYQNVDYVCVISWLLKFNRNYPIHFMMYNTDIQCLFYPFGLCKFYVLTLNY
jgi:hypothetical protein